MGSIRPDRRSFIGGSDARIIMSPDEAALIRLWKEKGGEAEPEDLSGNLIVGPAVAIRAQSGVAVLQSDSPDFVGFGPRKRTPFSGRNSMPAVSSAFCTSSRVEERLGGTSSTLSKR
jgi:hypothetical protein